MRKALILTLALPLALGAEVRNGGFDVLALPPTREAVAKFREAGVTCPDAGQWAQWWNCIGKAGEISFPTDGGAGYGRYAHLTGGSLMLTGYHGLRLSGDFVFEVCLRGTGEVEIGFLCYHDSGGGSVKSLYGGDAARNVSVKLSGGAWERYRFRIARPAELDLVHPRFRAKDGAVDIDNCRIYRADALMLRLADAEAVLRQTKFYDSPGAVRADTEAYRRMRTWFAAVCGRFAKFAPAEAFKAETEAARKAVEALAPYVQLEGEGAIQWSRFCDVFLLGGALQQLMDEPMDFPGVEIPRTAAPKTAPASVSAAVDGVALAVVPRKILYKQGENGVADVTLDNATGATVSGVLKAALYLDVGTRRDLAPRKVTLKPGRNGVALTFPVGKEMFGREIRVTFRSDDGRIVRSAREYFQAADEFMRVMMHGRSRYNNLRHYFAHEPTDFGVQETEDRQYLSCQPLYKVNRPAIDAQVRTFKRRGIKCSYYQNRAFGGIMGYEEVRKHPSYILYDANGQPQVDPVYGGTPNPFELAAPVEREKTRRAELLKGQKFLDLDLTSWQHVCADFTNPKVIEYGVECFIKYMQAHNRDAIYLDDTPSVNAGYRLSGEHCTRGKGMAEIAAMNTAIADLYHRHMRKLKPDVGSWCNGISPSSARWRRRTGMWECSMGMGVDVAEGRDVNDDFVRALTSYGNTMFLSEVQCCFREKADQPDREPEHWCAKLLEQRDYMIQQYGGSVVFGYLCLPDIKEPGDSNWFWPTLSHFHALTLATQHHHIVLGGTTDGYPSMQPFDQFMTRYSALLWGRDVKTVPADATKGLVTVAGDSEKDVLYRDFTYVRDGQDGGRDCIVHLVRKYPLKKWDLNWSVQPKTLGGLPVRFTVPAGMKAKGVKVMRPYLPDEKPEIVESRIEFAVEGDSLTFTLPDLVYYLMVVVQLER